MRHWVLSIVVVVVLLGLPGTALAQGRPFCRSGESPQFTFGFAALKGEIGAAMGEPVECAHPNDANGDVLQRTTTGLSFWRKSTNTPTFTDGFRHWGLTPGGLAYWEGSSVDPPSLAGSGLAAFAGTWERRDGHLTVFESGVATARWSAGSCNVLPPPCDRIVDGTRALGGLAELNFTEVMPGEPPTARGQVMFTSNSTFLPGPISLVRLSNDLVLLEQPGGRPLWWCRPPRNVNACGP